MPLQKSREKYASIICFKSDVHFLISRLFDLLKVEIVKVEVWIGQVDVKTGNLGVRVKMECNESLGEEIVLELDSECVEVPVFHHTYELILCGKQCQFESIILHIDAGVAVHLVLIQTCIICQV